MDDKNRYFTGNLPQSDMAKIYDIIVGFPSQQFYYNNGKKVLIKLLEGDNSTHPVLNSFTEISRGEAMEITSTDIV